jgi:hypothetical protein
VQARKPAGKLGGGLGVKKLDAKVDEGLFEQAPAAPEPVKPLPVAAAVQQEAEKPAAASRFAYDTLTAVSWLRGLRVQYLQETPVVGRLVSPGRSVWWSCSCSCVYHQKRKAYVASCTLELCPLF